MAPTRIDSRSGSFPDYDNSFAGGPDQGPTTGETIQSSERDLLQPIAIIGFSLKFPQEATTPEAFWQMLMQGRCAMTEFPKDRMNIDGFYHPDPKRHDAFPLRGAHFVAGDISKFDAGFFAITPAEAVAMDPQQRILMETAYHALENAGLPMGKVIGSKTSVHNGCFNNDYQLSMAKDPTLASKYSSTGGTATMLANRVSWFFDFSGPSLNLDSACSSSMVAFDIACQCLRNGDSTMGLVSGCNLVSLPDSTSFLSRMGFLSTDSRCFSFDHRANGYARGEGFGVLVIKLLSDAVRDGDTIRAVVRSTGSNQDGRTPGITQPSKDSQERLIRDTYAKAGLSLNRTTFFEAHGTGTQLGDVNEGNAIGSVFQQRRTKDQPLIVGAVKANIGHLEGASGVAGLIKTVLALEKAIIPPNTNFERLNPRIDAEFLNLSFPVKPMPWPTQGLRRASINSFGIGGTNSHAILDDAYNYLLEHNITAKHRTVVHPPSSEDLNPIPSLGSSVDIVATVADSCPAVNGSGTVNGINGLSNLHTLNHLVEPENFDRPVLLVWSAADKATLQRMVATYSEHFARLTLPAEDIRTYLEQLAFTLTFRRSLLPWKTSTVASSILSLQQVETAVSPPVRSVRANPELAFVFTGQGAQWYAMGRELLTYPVFRNSLLLAEAEVLRLGSEWKLLDEFLRGKETSKVDSPAFSQPLCTALQIALVELLRSFGLNASAVVGHSSGEIAAAYCIGAISSRSAIRLAYYRGSLSALLPKKFGAMMSVGLSEDGVLPYLEQITLQFQRKGLCIACINSHKNVTISGDSNQIDALKPLLDAQQVFARKLQVDVAYHSPHMNAIASDYLALIAEIEEGDIPSMTPSMVSSVTGEKISVEELRHAEYWVKNMVSPVRFSNAITTTCRKGKMLKKKLDGSHRKILQLQDLVELGPHSALQGPIRDILMTMNATSQYTYHSALIRKIPATDTILQAAGRLHCGGYPINFASVNQLSIKSSRCPRMLIDLPEYPFDHAIPYWHESRLSSGFRFRKYGRLDLLGAPAPDWNPLEPKWKNSFIIAEMPWLEDHKLNGSILYPGAGMIVMAIEAAHQLADCSRPIAGFNIKNATFLVALTIPQRPEGIETEFYMSPLRDVGGKDSSWFQFKLCTLDDGQWSENCHGSIQILYKKVLTEVDNCQEARKSYNIQRMESGVRNCAKSVETAYMYQRLHECGYSYGPTFSPVDNISCSGFGEATGDVKTFESSAPSDVKHIQPHVIHPTTLDGIFQLNLIAISNGGTENIPTLAPTRIQKMWISASNISGTSAGRLTTYSKSAYKGYRNSISSMLVSSEVDGQTRMIIDGFEATIVSKSSIASEVQSSQKQICYNMDWKPDLDFLTSDEILAYCESSSTSESESEPVLFYQELDLVQSNFVTEALDALQSQDLKVLKPEHQKYIGWMKGRVGGLPKNSQQEELSQDSEYHNALCSRVEKSCNEGSFYVSVGRNLLSILSGTIDVVDFFFSNDLVARYYQEMFEKVACTKSLSRYIDAMCHKNPAMKVVEVGAGTGGMTNHVLDALTFRGENGNVTPRFARYDYTDISRSFFEKAQERFKNYGSVIQYRALDVEEDPTTQGFDVAEYDVVVAAIVLHATNNLDSSTRHLRKLLKPGGKLLLFEIVKPEILRTGFAFGLFPGWWTSSEEHRQLNPCINEEEWHDVLSRQGFSGSELILRDYCDETCHETSVIISTAVDEPLNISISRPKTFMLTEPDSLAQRQLALKIAEHLELEGFEYQVLSIPQVVCDDSLKSTFCISLLEVERPCIQMLTQDTYPALQRLLTTAKGLVWVSCRPENSPNVPDYGMVDGLGRCLRTENSALPFVSMALESLGDKTNIERHAESIAKVFSNIATEDVSDDYEPEYMERNGMLHINRLIEAPSLSEFIASKTVSHQVKVREFGAGPPLKLSVASPGLLDSLQFLEDTEHFTPLAPNDLEIQVHATGVNFMDCLVALGQINHATIGGECAGIVTRVGSDCKAIRPGDRVAACTLDTYRTYVRCSAELVVKIFDDLSFVEAASLPLTFATVYHALIHVAQMQEGESILIHSGAGGTGQAAVQIAQHLNAEIYVTVGTVEKRELMTDTYGIPKDHVFSSRDINFAKDIQRKTNERGVDVILNSLSGEGLIASWECMANFGRFIEIGKKDIYAHSNLPMFPFSKNVSFCAVDLASMPAMGRTDVVSKSFRGFMALVNQRVLRPATPLHVYTISEVEKAFRYMQSGKNTGKMVVTVDATDQVLTSLQTKPTYQFDESASYLIAGGLGGLGRSIARWMVGRGAKHLVLLSRSGPQNSAAQDLVDELVEMGVQVEAPACDITDMELLKTFLEEYSKKSIPIKGCIQGSMVLRDSIFEKMTFSQWQASVNPKVRGSWNLHALLPGNFDFFVLLSSVSGIFGSPTQANYAAGNAYMDALAHYRILQSQKAVSIDLGALLSEGILAENKNLRERFTGSGIFIPITQAELFGLLDYYCNPSIPILSSLEAQPMLGIEVPANIRARGHDEPYWLRRPLFRNLYQIRGTNSTITTNSEQAVNFATAFAEAESLAEAGAIVTQALAIKLSKSLSIVVADLDMNKPMHSSGVDSLMAVELRNWFAKELGADVAIFDILSGATMKGIGLLAAAKSKFRVK